MKETRMVGSETKYKTSHMNHTYGTVNKANCKAIFINSSAWLTLHPDVEDKLRVIDKIQRWTSREIRALVREVCPDNFLFSIVDFQIGELVGRSQLTGYMCFEITILFKESINYSINDKVLMNNIQGFCGLVEAKLLETSGDYSISNKRSKVIEAQALIP